MRLKTCIVALLLVAALAYAATPTHIWVRDLVKQTHGQTTWQVWPMEVALTCPNGQVFARVQFDFCLTHGTVKLYGTPQIPPSGFTCLGTLQIVNPK